MILKNGRLSLHILIYFISLFRIRVLLSGSRSDFFFPESGSGPAIKSGSDPEKPKKCKYKKDSFIIFSTLNTFLFGQVPAKPNQRAAFRSHYFLKAKTGQIRIRIGEKNTVPSGSGSERLFHLPHHESLVKQTWSGYGFLTKLKDFKTQRTQESNGIFSDIFFYTVHCTKCTSVLSVLSVQILQMYQ